MYVFICGFYKVTQKYQVLIKNPHLPLFPNCLIALYLSCGSQQCNGCTFAVARTNTRAALCSKISFNLDEEKLPKICLLCSNTINIREFKLLSTLAVAVPGTFCRNWNLCLAEANLGKLRLSVSSTELSRDGKTRTRKYLNYFGNWLHQIKMKRRRRTLRNRKKQEVMKKVGMRTVNAKV